MYDNVRYLFNVHHRTLSIQEICSGKDHTRYMASHGLAHASPRDAMWKTAGRHMGDAVSLSTLSISTMPKRYYHAHFPYRKDAFSENKS